MFERLLISAFVVALSLLAPFARAQDPAPASPDVQSQLADLKSRLAKLEGAPAKASLSSFNPAMGAALDAAFLDKNDKAGFQFRALELNVEAPVDPYLKAWGVITGSNNGGGATVDVEEATLETTSLPHNLTVRGGRLFATFGRLAHFHDHELPVIERPASLDTFIGGETRADGLEASVLMPTDLFLTATFGAYDKMGAGNTRQDPAGSRPLDEFTYMGRLNTYLDLTDAQSVELGVDSAWTPKRTVVPTAVGVDALHKDTWRSLSGLDVTYRYQPPVGGLYKGLLWGTELLQNDERRIDPATNLPTARRVAYAGYSFVELRSGRHWRGGVMADLTENQDNPRLLAKTFTGFLTYDVSEFQRLRATYAESVANAAGPTNHTFGLQWTGVFGNHVHGFRDR